MFTILSWDVCMKEYDPINKKLSSFPENRIGLYLSKQNILLCPCKRVYSLKYDFKDLQRTTTTFSHPFMPCNKFSIMKVDESAFQGVHFNCVQ